MRTENVNYLKQNADSLPLDEPITIVQNGKPVFVIESYQQHKERDEAMALMKLLSLSVRDSQAGRLSSGAALKQRLLQRKMEVAGNQDGTAS